VSSNIAQYHSLSMGVSCLGTDIIKEWQQAAMLAMTGSWTGPPWGKRAPKVELRERGPGPFLKTIKLISGTKFEMHICCDGRDIAKARASRDAEL